MSLHTKMGQQSRLIILMGKIWISLLNDFTTYRLHVDGDEKQKNSENREDGRDLLFIYDCPSAVHMFVLLTGIYR